MRLQPLITALGLAALLLLAGCLKLGPDFKPPDPPTALPQNWQHGSGRDYVSQDRWWEAYGDSQLNHLVLAAFKHNWDLKRAAARILEIEALFVQSDAARYPRFDFSAGASKQKNSNPLTRSLARTERYNLALAASFELDLWGRLARASEAARADLLQSELNRRTVAQGVVASVVTAYLQMESLERRIEVQKRSIKAFEDSFFSVERRYKRGLSDILDLRQARRALAASRAQLPALELELGKQQLALSVLVGSYPKTSPARRQDAAYFPRLAPVPAGLPSGLILRRPDLRAALANLEALNARVGAARANRFPKISLTGNYGYASGELGDLIEPASKLWQLAAGITQPIFDAGRLAAQEEAARARYQQGLASFAQSALKAFSEVESALYSRKMLMERRALVQKSLTEAIATQKAALNRYNRGLTDYLRVLEAQRARYQFEDTLVLVELGLLTNRVALHRALGGGWDETAQAETIKADKS
jgi:multidrug efflux system outer membrane protein